MAFVSLNDVTLHYRHITGDGVPIVFLNSLGTDFRIWDAVIAGLGDRIHSLCLDKRGHGLSDDGPTSMAGLARDVAALMDHLGLGASLICGVSVGGMIAQSLASTRPDLVSGLVLCCTGAKIGTAEAWNDRIATVTKAGIGSMSDAILERWFSPRFRTTETAALNGYGNMLTRTSATGYAGVCAAIRDSDLTTTTSAITVPTACLAGQEDLATPPALVQDLAGLIDGASCQIIDGCGHLPCIEKPEIVADTIRQIHGRLP